MVNRCGIALIFGGSQAMPSKSPPPGSNSAPQLSVIARDLRGICGGFQGDSRSFWGIRVYGLRYSVDFGGI